MKLTKAQRAVLQRMADGQFGTELRTPDAVMWGWNRDDSPINSTVVRNLLRVGYLFIDRTKGLLFATGRGRDALKMDTPELNRSSAQRVRRAFERDAKRQASLKEVRQYAPGYMEAEKGLRKW